MKQRAFGSSGVNVSEIGLGCWQLGGTDWGDVSEEDALTTLQAAVTTHFPENDHRNYNRDGHSFNVGETFAGLMFEKGVDLADALKSMVPSHLTMTQMALRWCLDYDAISVVIPGAKNPQQVAINAGVSKLPPLSDQEHKSLKVFYETDVIDHIRGSY